MFKAIYEVLFLIVKIENNLNVLKKAWLNNLLVHPNNEIQYHAAIKRKRYLFAEMENKHCDILLLAHAWEERPGGFSFPIKTVALEPVCMYVCMHSCLHSFIVHLLIHLPTH